MKWISIKEEFPQLNVSDSGMFSQPILVTDGIEIQVMSLRLRKFDNEIEFNVDCCSYPLTWSLDDVKYWMPLPPIPIENN